MNEPAAKRFWALTADQAWHSRHADEAVAALECDVTHGLTRNQAQARLATFGPNALPEAPRRGPVRILLRQFQNPLIYLLLLAAGIALSLGATSDAAVIGVVVMLNAVIGSIQEGRAERSLAALRSLTEQQARVLRDGAEAMVAARLLVPGDLIVLNAGDAVSADARLVEGAALQIAEAALTGESVPVAKELPALAEDTVLAERCNMVYAGTHVTAGRARAVVVATGLATEIGHIAALTANAEEPPTPLERRIQGFGRAVMIAAVGLTTVVISVGVWRGVAFAEMFMIGVSQLVGMVPEGLPVAMTIALAVGVQRMARRRAVVRRLSAVETLGSTSVICTDKTGTLTRNEMTATTVVLPDAREIAVSGIGYAPDGELTHGKESLRWDDDPTLADLLQAATLCNDAHLHGPDATATTWRAVGDPTEVALLTLAIKAGGIPADLRRRFRRRAEIPFDSGTKMMATQHEANGSPFVLLKGAPEVVLDLCAATNTETMRATAAALASRGLRVLAFGRADGCELDGHQGFAPLAGRACVLGLIAQTDPPRPEVADAIGRCQNAGIRPVMVTGDHKETAVAIARQLGIMRPGNTVIDGNELERLTDEALADRIVDATVFARVHPAQKLRIVEAFQNRGEVVAVTGDGVNDAPALARADVGVAMGLTGTEVAKDAAKIVITDDNFTTIIAAVEEGRVAYRNIKKAILLLFSTSAAEVIVLLLAMACGYPPPFAAVQILWNNLVTEGVITINLVLESAEGDEMRRPPIHASEALVTGSSLGRMATMVATIVAATFGWFAWRTHQGIAGDVVRTEAFTLLAICEWFNVLNCRSEMRSAFDAGLLRNRWLLAGLLAGNLLQIAVVFWAPLGGIFHTTPIDFRAVLALGVVGSGVLWVEELRKLITRGGHPHGERAA